MFSKVFHLDGLEKDSIAPILSFIKASASIADGYGFPVNSIDHPTVFDTIVVWFTNKSISLVSQCFRFLS
jgi:hypothetical protein